MKDLKIKMSALQKEQKRENKQKERNAGIIYMKDDSFEIKYLLKFENGNQNISIISKECRHLQST